MTRAIEHDFELVLGRFHKAEADLIKALDAKDAAYAEERAPDERTAARMQAARVERVAIEHWESVERARAAYWRERARPARKEIFRILPALLAEAVYCSRFSGSVEAVQQGIANEIACMSLPPLDHKTTIPAQPIESDVLDRAEDEVSGW